MMSKDGLGRGPNVAPLWGERHGFAVPMVFMP